MKRGDKQFKINFTRLLGGPTAQIIERKGWKCDKDFVGHRKAVNCVVRTTLLKDKILSFIKHQIMCDDASISIEKKSFSFQKYNL